VSNEKARSGQYALKMTIWSANRTSGCRTFRQPEVRQGIPYFYGCWYYLPELYTVSQVSGSFWNIFQFKSKTAYKSAVFWKIDLRTDPSTGNLFPCLIWNGDGNGPFARQPHVKRQLFAPPPNTPPIPVAQWFHLEVFLDQSPDFTGRIAVWYDGRSIFDLKNVRTHFQGGTQGWSVNNYGRGITPEPTTMFIDDVTVSTNRAGP
jgi:hypothetical protein